jgi:hypothetical protein
MKTPNTTLHIIQLSTASCYFLFDSNILLGILFPDTPSLITSVFPFRIQNENLVFYVRLALVYSYVIWGHRISGDKGFRKHCHPYFTNNERIILNLYSARINLWLLYVGPIVLFWWCYKFEKKIPLSPISLPWLVMLTLAVIRRFSRTGWPVLSYLKSRKFYGNVTVIALLWLVIQNIFTMLTVWWTKNCWPTHSLTAQRGTPLLWPSCRTSLALYLSESSELCINLQWMMLYRVSILFGHEEAGKWTEETGLSPARRQDRVQTK